MRDILLRMVSARGRLVRVVGKASQTPGHERWTTPREVEWRTGWVAVRALENAGYIEPHKHGEAGWVLEFRITDSGREALVA